MGDGISVGLWLYYAYIVLLILKYHSSRNCESAFMLVIIFITHLGNNGLYPINQNNLFIIAPVSFVFPL